MTLLLVNKADQGLFNTLMDAIHKAVAPHTDACRLCYSNDRADISLPVLLLEREGDLQMLVSADEINACRDLQTLMDKVSAAFAARAPS